MAKEKEKSGFQSSAGLIRYFDTEDERSLKISPYFVVGLAVALSVIVIVVGYIWPT